MLCAVRRAYDKVEVRAKTAFGLGDPFLSMLGVKQGDPLSTELFGLFIETLGDLIDAHDADDGPCRNSARTRRSWTATESHSCFTQMMLVC